MTGFISTYDGATLQLPSLLSWELALTDGEPCGSCRVCFAADADCAQKLQKAVRFWAVEGGQRVFTGVVDEVELRLDAGGYTAELAGRDLAALLLDNQTRAAEFATAHLRDVLARYVTPCGVTKVDAQALPAVAGFSVGTGESCWRVLEGFCRHAANVRPHFLPDGTLRLRKKAAGKVLRLSQLAAVEAISLRRRRYGVISSQTVVDLSRKTVQTVPNASFQAQMGKCEKVVCQSGWTTGASWRTAQQRIEESVRGSVELTALLPGMFLAAPGDRVTVEGCAPGIVGTFLVSTAVTRLGGDGLSTHLSLREDC